MVRRGFIWLAGQVADALRMRARTPNPAPIEALAAEAAGQARLLSVPSCWPTCDAAPMNRAWDAWLDRGHKPARMTIQAALVDPRWKVEITGVALAP